MRRIVSVRMSATDSTLMLPGAPGGPDGVRDQDLLEPAASMFSNAFPLKTAWVAAA